MAIYVRAINGMTNHTAGDLRGDMADLLESEGVSDVDGGHLLVKENGTPNLSVLVDPGIFWVANDSWSSFSSSERFWDGILDAQVNPSISSNPLGSNRIDLICVKIDTVVVPDADASNVASIVVVEGTAGAGAPALPNDHLQLATVTVVPGATSITNSDIVDDRVQITLRSAVGGGGGVAGGWTEVTDSWTYSSYTAATRIGLITVPSDATTVYQPGMRLRFTQPTDGVKYGLIHKVDTTTLHVFMNSDYDLDNEAITDISYSISKAPLGFNIDPLKWQVSVTNSTDVSQATPSNGVWYEVDSLDIGVGSWLIEYRTSLRANYGVAKNVIPLSTTLSDASATENINEYTVLFRDDTTDTSLDDLSWHYSAQLIELFTTTQTRYLNMRIQTGGSLDIVCRGASDYPIIIRATSQYL